jgi:hypothetical protein
MSNVVSMREQALDPAVIESIVIKGDLSGLNQTQKVAYYNFRCQQAGLDPAAKPFDLLTLKRKAGAICQRKLHATTLCHPQAVNSSCASGTHG